MDQIQMLEPGVESFFESLLERGLFEDAIEYLDNCVNKIPSPGTLNSILFDVLMNKDCVKRTTIEAGCYVMKILSCYPPSDCNRRQYYKKALFSERNPFPNLWAVFCHLVESSFCHYKIYRVDDEEDNQMQPVQHPNCDILIDFYVKVFTESYECLFNERAKRTEKSLVSELFWPSVDGEYRASSENPRKFLGWINSIYEHMTRIQTVNVFTILNQFLNLMVRSIIDSENPLDQTNRLTDQPDSLICNHRCLLNTGRDIMSFCPAAFQSHEAVKKFVSHIQLKYLCIKICESTLHEVIYNKQERNFAHTTLKDIITMYMLPKPMGKRGRKKKQKAPEISRKEKAPVPNIVLKLNRTGNTVLHEACRLNKPADLFENLISNPPPDINAKNSVGYTPLHLSSMSDTFLCAKTLIDHCRQASWKQKLDFKASDEDGLTALHFAVQKDVIQIAKLILTEGGSTLLNCVDKFGNKPHHYCNSVQMENLLKDFQPSDVDAECEQLTNTTSITFLTNTTSIIFDRGTPNNWIFKKYALYFHTLQFVLSYYLEIYHLRDIYKMFKRDEDASSIVVCKHEEKTCPHFAHWNGKEVCSYDFEYLKLFPKIVENFINLAKEHCKEKKIRVDLEIFPLTAFISSLKD